MEPSELLPAELLVPHRGRSRLIEWVKRPTQNGLQAGATVTEEWPLNRDGTVSSLMCIELVAQAVSALSTWRRGEGARPRVGLLLGIKEAEFSHSSVPVWTRLITRIDMLSRIGNYAVFQAQVSSDLGFSCIMTIQVMEPEEEVLSNLKTRQGTRPGEKERGD
jgi:predicted hotdog family 3-hydroxylacyl-ACP dehydratase